MIKQASQAQTQQQPPQNVTTNPRIVSLLPGFTDIIHELGLSQYIVANSHECESRTGFPITFPKLPVTNDLSSKELSAGWNMASLDHGLDSVDILSKRTCSFYSVNTEQLLQSSPTLILTHLAKPRSFMDPDEQELKEFLHAHIPSLRTIMSATCRDLSEIYSLYHSVAYEARCGNRAVQTVAQARTKLNMIKRNADSMVKGRTSKRPRVAVIQWTDPLYIAGDWIPQIIPMAGGSNAVTVPGGPSVPISPSRLTEMDVLIFAMCAVGVEGCKMSVGNFWRSHRNEFRGWKGKIIVTDATRLFSRPALNTVIESAEVIADSISGCNLYGHEGKLWDEWDDCSSMMR